MQLSKLMYGFLLLIGYFKFFLNNFINFLFKDKLLDKELKPPFLPPKSKMISEKDIEKMIVLNKNIVDEIKVFFFLKRIFKFNNNLFRLTKKASQNQITKTKIPTQHGKKIFEICNLSFLRNLTK